MWKVDKAHWQKQGGQALDPGLLRINSIPISGKGEPRDLLGSWDSDSQTRAEIRRSPGGIVSRADFSGAGTIADFLGCQIAGP